MVFVSVGQLVTVCVASHCGGFGALGEVVILPGGGVTVVIG